MYPIITVLGLVLLLVGSQLYWLFVGGVSIIFASYLANQFNFITSQIGLIIYALSAGVLGVLLVFILKKPVIIIAGFIAGGYVGINLPSVLDLEGYLQTWQIFLLLGGICALLLVVSLDWSLIFVSALTGATIVAQRFTLQLIETSVFFFFLSIFGCFIQIILMQYGRPGKKKEFG